MFPFWANVVDVRPIYKQYVSVQIQAGPDGSFVSTGACNLQTVQRPGVYSAAYSTMHYKEPFKSFEIRVGHSPGFGLLSVAILP